LLVAPKEEIGMTTRRLVAVILGLLALLAVGRGLQTPTSMAAEMPAAQQTRPTPGVPHREPVPPAVLALDGRGEPTLVSLTNPVPVQVQGPVPITTSTPLPVNDGGQVITATGNYKFVFANEVTLPGLGGNVASVDVTVTQIAGKWVNATYNGSSTGQSRNPVTLVFNTEQLLAIMPSR
jgi:hypothetical protein